VELFDIFDFEEKGETSFAFHIVFGSSEKTLGNKEVDELMKKITTGLEKEFEVEVRK
jgi:phenylalanyl-tRNA synthetase beta subunit